MEGEWVSALRAMGSLSLCASPRREERRGRARFRPLWAGPKVSDG